MYYSANVAYAYVSIMYINNEIYYGWWIRFLHSNGASWFFIVVYIHIFRGLFYGSYMYPRQALWLSGMLIWVLMIATAFLGYVLPWGQMSFWGAMVITSLLGAIPLVGGEILFLLWGGFTIDDVTLRRFYALHFFLPFVILAIAILHIIFLHEFGSNNPLGIVAETDNLTLFPYYALKDFLFIIGIWFIFLYIIFYAPDYLGHSDNYIWANVLVTPPHIVPEWYFLPLFAVLRSVTDKLLGIFLIFCFIVALFLIPFLFRRSIVRSTFFKPLYRFVFWFFVGVCFTLGWIGKVPIVVPYIYIGQFVTVAYFATIVVFLPLALRFDKLFYYSLADEFAFSMDSRVKSSKSSVNAFFNKIDRP